MARLPNRKLVPVDLSLALALTIAAVLVSLLPVADAVSVLVGIPFLVFIPGYAVTAALFPQIRGQETISPLERFALSAATSVAMAIIVGVNLEFTMWPIEAPSVAGMLGLVTIAGIIVGAVRRSRLQANRSEQITGERADSVGSSNSSKAATLMVVFAVAVSLASVAVVAGMNERGEQYTEFGLLVEDETGNLTADGFPSELSVGEETALYYTITNKEQQSEQYTVIVRLESVAEDGSVGQVERVGSYQEQVPSNETVTREHTVTPTLGGEDLRLRYLLYRSEPPADPSADDAYRDLHLWVDVTDGTVGDSGGVDGTEPGNETNESVTETESDGPVFG